MQGEELDDDTKRHRELAALDKAIVELEEWRKIYKQQVRKLGGATYNVRHKFDLLQKRCCAKWWKLFPDEHNPYDDDF